MELGTHEVRLLPSHRDWEVGAPSGLMNTLQRDGSQVERELPPWICKTGKKLQRRLTYISKRERKILELEVF